MSSNNSINISTTPQVSPSPHSTNSSPSGTNWAPVIIGLIIMLGIFIGCYSYVSRVGSINSDIIGLIYAECAIGFSLIAYTGVNLYKNYFKNKTTALPVPVSTHSSAAPHPLTQANAALKAQIEQAQPPATNVKEGYQNRTAGRIFTPPPPEVLAQQECVFPICPNIFLGNITAYRSIDPKFRIPIRATETIFANPSALTPEQRDWLKDNEIIKGCAQLSIQSAVCVQQGDESTDPVRPKSISIPILELRLKKSTFSLKAAQPHFKEIFKRIDEAREKNQNILIFCEEGDRSPLILCAYFINRLGVSAEKAMNYVVSCRPHTTFKPSWISDLNTYAQRGTL